MGTEFYHLINTPENFSGGKVIHSVSDWRQITSDSWILDVIQGHALQLDHCPAQNRVPPPLILPPEDYAALNTALQAFLRQNIIEPCPPTAGPVFYSNVFPRIKSDGSARVILNLKQFNKQMDKIHFKMDTLRDVIDLIYPNCYFASVDFKHAYFSVPISGPDRRWLRFLWAGEHFQFTCLPQGLTSAPRVFTKMLKPVLAYLRKRGMIVSAYIDDCIFIGHSPSELASHIKFAVQLFDRLGLTIHPDKSNFKPTQKIVFLGFILDSVAMTVTLDTKKQQKIRDLSTQLLSGGTVTIRELAAFIGNAVAADPGVPRAALKYKYLEIIRNRALLCNKGDYDGSLVLDRKATDLLCWWRECVDQQSKSIWCDQPQFYLFTDASLSGWGAKLGPISTGGQWADQEVAHINVLELRAVLFGLQSLCGHIFDAHIRIRSDNTTTVACIERCSSTKPQLLDIIEQIFAWTEGRRVTLSAAHIQGVHNVEADLASRVFNVDTEWMISPHVFHKLCVLFSKPKVDLFASRINAQLPNYVSWRPDPHALAVDAFSFSWTDRILYYGFPPFSIIGQTLRKLLRDGATMLLVLPLWPTKPWFPRALQLLAAPPYLLPRDCLTLPQEPSLRHPLPKLRLAAMMLSGQHTITRDFLGTLPPSSWDPGDRELTDNMGVISPNGSHFVILGRSIHFRHL